VVVNHVGARELVRDADGVRGAVVEDALGGRRITVRARVVVNATGPWSDEIRRRAEPDAAPSLRGTRGAHIAVSRERIRNNGALTVTSPIDGRVMFILPAGAFTIIGTTDTDYEGSPDAVRATSEDVIYLLRSANAYFPAAHLAASDVVAAWAGIRPLVARPDGEPGSVSREHAILWTARGLLTVSGGKLTTYRAMGAEVVDAVAKSLRVKSRPAPTDRTRLPGGEIASVEGEIDQAKATIGAADVAEHLVHAYGSHWRALWKMAADDLALAERLLPDRPYIVAELHWATQYEMALTIGDVLIRRTHVAFETRDHGWSIAPRVAALLAPLLGWDAERTARELGRYRGEIERIFGT
jgi:glycerol-3-phosphate dehydrogenase